MKQGDPKTRLRRWYLAVLTLTGAICAYNALCIVHAHAMTTYVDSGMRTDNPEDLGVGGKIKALLFGVSLPHPTNELSPAAVNRDYRVQSRASHLQPRRRPGGVAHACQR